MSDQVTQAVHRGLKFERAFGTEGVHPFDEVEWEVRTARIDGKDGPVFEQPDFEAPASWSDTARAIVAEKYAYGRLGTDERETSVRQIIWRVVNTIAESGSEWGYFAENESRRVFAQDLAYLLVNQFAAFNSPVWFNMGCRPGTGYAWDFARNDVARCEDIGEPRYTGSACFIVGVEDSIDSIGRNAAVEMDIFKYGSGAGSDRSRLRSRLEPVTGGGKASGPVSFMRIYDAVGAVTKSGGIVRRAAKMEILRVDHPDILEFIECKTKEEEKAKALIAAGYEADFNGEAYSSVLFQNSNLSVRVTDEFMRAVEEDREWQTLAVRTGKPEAADGTTMPRYKARWLMDRIAETAWRCGDPGIQYDDVFQRWNTIPAAGPIRATNPCAEYCSIDDSACNLASINLMKFRNEDGSFDVDRFRAAVRVLIVAMDIIVDLGSYPTAEIARNAHRYRQLGLGYANLGSLIMASGLPYDSNEARSLAGAIASLMTGQAYLTSVEMAEQVGAFDGYAANKGPMQRVMDRHKEAAYVASNSAENDGEGIAIWAQARDCWRMACAGGWQHGYRNSESSCIAPTGTIALMMGCPTTGIEPSIALVSYKNLWGRGQLKLVNGTVPLALRTLGYEEWAINKIVDYIDHNGTVEGLGMKLDHFPVFDCAFPARPGGRSIPWQGHVKMLAAVQPHVAMSISKCVTGDTMLVTNEGLIRIGALYAKEEPDTFRSISLSVPSTAGGAVGAKDFYYGGVKPVWRVSLSDGRTISGTDRHRLRTVVAENLDWGYLSKLQPGDFVALHRGTEMWGNSRPPKVDLSPLYGGQHAITIPEESTFDLGLFLGMLAADGHVTESNYVVGITKNSEEVLSEFQSLLRKLFGLSGRRIVDERNGVQGVTIGSKCLMEWLRGIGFSKEHIPDFLLRSPRPALLGYLSGLYLDGYITKGGDVAISQKYRTLLNDVQAVWDNLGVPTYFTANVVNGRDYPVLHVLASHRRTAADLIYWVEPHKAAIASDLCDGNDRRPFPIHRTALVELVRSQSRLAEFKNAINPKTAQICRDTFFDVADKAGLLLAPGEKAMDYLQVISVEYAGEQPVYDLSVPETEAFVGNGIVNHNTVNMPADATVADIRAAYILGWKLGLKALAIYRDGCKGSQPVSTSKGDAAEARPPTIAHATAVPGALQEANSLVGNGSDVDERGNSAGAVPGGMGTQRSDGGGGGSLRPAVALLPGVGSQQTGRDPSAEMKSAPRRERLPDTRASITHKGSVGNVEFYLTVGQYPDGRPGELFITMAKEGSTVGGLMDQWATSISLGLQYGVPVQVFVGKFKGQRFEPSGSTHNQEIPFAWSIMDYIARWLGMQYVPGYEDGHSPAKDGNGQAPIVTVPVMVQAPACTECGNICVPTGRCWCCPVCGTSIGACG